MPLTDVVRTATRPFRRVARILATADPDLSRLRTAATTITTLLVVAVVLFTLAALTGLSAIAVIPGLIVTMLASTAVREPRPGPRAVAILLLLPSSVATISLASVVSGTPLLADAVFVAVAFAAVMIRAIGPRGVAIGMVGFMSYFLAIFTKVSPAEIPVVAGAVTIAALLTIALRYVFRPRHPDRDLRRMLRALGVRAGRVLDAVDDGVRAGTIDERLRRSIRSRLAASGSTAASVEQALETAAAPLVLGVDNDDLGVRVFDFQLVLERLCSTVRRVLDDGSASPEQLLRISARLRELRRAVHSPLRLDGPPGSTPALLRAPSPRDQAPHDARPGAHVSEAGISDADERLESLSRILRFAFAAWQGIVTRGPDALDETPTDTARKTGNEDARVESATPPPRTANLGRLWRTAVQVAVAAALAIAAGTALSSTRWFWAVIAAFVVFVGTSTRGEILTKGWLRVIGTLGGVVAGVLIAGLVGGNVPVSVVLIVVALFLGFYLMSISSAFMIFFITTMLALLYGILGEFSVALLLTRLEETAAGAAIGILVSYVVFPNSTSGAVRGDVRTFLGELAAAIRLSGERLTDVRGDTDDQDSPAGRETARLGAISAPDDVRALRESFAALGTTSKPLTQGLAGVSDRSGSRRTMLILASCEHHARALVRAADGAVAAASDAAVGDVLDRAIRAVLDDVERFTGALEERRMSRVVFRPADALIDAFEDHPAVVASRHRIALVAAARHLHAVDQALCGRGSELGATLEPLTA
ncbi:FUSC family protein [Frondihabitans cladoniiphilus]|uniref:Integral membrane bound transporter domain-containing protein n=1 Tax=Frondihabitans cladoniiphilus TaxID=715785 RepID=A0ABP8WDK0_9MICO